ncbi:MAG: hypothetical protein Q9222_002965 [Ikaeria aurantiellina]
MAEPAEAEASTAQAGQRTWTYQSIGLDDWDTWIKHPWGEEILQACKDQVASEFRVWFDNFIGDTPPWLDEDTKQKMAFLAIDEALKAWMTKPFEPGVEPPKVTKERDRKAKLTHVKAHEKKYESEMKTFLDDYEVDYRE